MLTLRRAYLDEVTLGRIEVGQQTFTTLELPWRGNEPGQSCIPEGVYTMRKRTSPVVNRTTRGAYTEGWEIEDVTGRSFIMIHPGNFIKDTDGCILPGRGFSWLASDGFMVTHSQAAFARLMTALSCQGEWNIMIRCNQPGFP